MATAAQICHRIKIPIHSTDPQQDEYCDEEENNFEEYYDEYYDEDENSSEEYYGEDENSFKEG